MNWKRLKIRLQSAWECLTTEFILISHIGTFQDSEGRIGRKWVSKYRTRLPDEIDFLVVKGEVMHKWAKLPSSVKKEYHP